MLDLSGQAFAQGRCSAGSLAFVEFQSISIKYTALVAGLGVAPCVTGDDAHGLLPAGIGPNLLIQQQLPERLFCILLCDNVHLPLSIHQAGAYVYVGVLNVGNNLLEHLINTRYHWPHPTGNANRSRKGGFLSSDRSGSTGSILGYRSQGQGLGNTRPWAHMLMVSTVSSAREWMLSP